MKKLLVIFLSMLYAVMSFGFTTYTHFCKGVKQTTSFSNIEQSSDKPCTICASKDKQLQKKKQGCCKQEAQLVKVSDTAQKSYNQAFNLKFWGDAILNRTLGVVFDINIESDLKTTFPASPDVLIRNNPLYILHCVYRI